VSQIENYINTMITKKVSEHEFLEILNTCKVNKKKLEVFHAFISKLNKLIHDTYLGREYIINPEDVKGHFDWCFNKTCELFNLMNISFYGNHEVWNHFYEYFMIYVYENEKPMMEKDIERFYEQIFSLHGDRFVFQVHELIDLYNKFNKSLKYVKTNNLLTQ
jgi:hypothetical protein